MNVVEWHQAAALAELGHQVDLITRRSSPDAPDSLEIAPGITLRHLPAGPPQRLAKSAIDAHIAEFAAGLANLPRYDVVHSHHWMSGVAALPVARGWGVPHVQSFHSVAAHPGSSLHEGEPPESPDRVPGEALAAQESDAVVAISAAEARTVVERCGGDPARVQIIAPGVDGQLFHPGPGSLPPYPNGYLLFAARLQPLKGPDLAIAALAEVPEQIRPHLLVAGDTSPDFADYQRTLDQLVLDLDLAGYVSFIGPQPRDSLADLMRGARITLVPSYSETFGLIALESAASGTPVIASAAGGLREAVAHGETGQLMDSRQPEHWGMAITRLLTKRGLLERMGLVSRIHSRRFDWRWSARHLEALYQQLIEARSVADPLAGAGHVLFAHAHPDDETLATGALIADLVARGVRVSVLTATRGEQGQVVAGPLSSLEGTPALIAHRERELAGAVAALGVSQHAFLGEPPARADGRPTRRYQDSGMQWITPTVAGPGPDAGPDAFCVPDRGEAVADTEALLAAWRPDVVVSYDALGGYGHPDHVRMHEVARDAAAAFGVPFVEVVSIPRDGSEPDGANVAWLSLGQHLPQVKEALSHHASQVTVDGREVVHSGGQREPIQLRTGLRRG